MRAAAQACLGSAAAGLLSAAALALGLSTLRTCSCALPRSRSLAAASVPASLRP